MKTKAFIGAIALALASSATTFAQDSATFSRAIVGYQQTMYGTTPQSGKIYNTDGLSVGILNSKAISSSANLAVEYGARLNFGYHGVTDKHPDKKVDISTTTSLTTLNFDLPTNLTYRLKVSDNFSIVPFAGINVRCNFVSANAVTYSGADVPKSYKDKHSANFNWKDVGRDNVWNWLQAGGQVGVYFDNDKLFGVLEYGRDFTPIVQTNTTKHITLGVGVKF